MSIRSVASCQIYSTKSFRFRHNATRNATNGFESSLSPHHFQEPIIEERNSLDALKVFITHACEVLGLWRILCDNQLHNIVSCLTKDQVNQFTTATYRDLILIGHEISSLLIIHLIDRYVDPPTKFT